MQEDEYKKETNIKPLSNTAAEIKPPIVLDETKNYYTAFKLKWVINPNNPNYCIDGYFVYAKCNKKDYEESKIDKFTIENGSAFSISLHSEQLYKFYCELDELYKCFRDQPFPKKRIKIY